MSTICLAMLARDEEDTIAAAIEAARPVVDKVLVMDTGSTDDTVAVAREHGTVISRPWRGFADARTDLLWLARIIRCDYTLMLDADHTLHVHGDKPDLTADSYLVRINDAWGGRLPLLTRSGHPFEYRGAAHCYLSSPEPTRQENTDWISVDGGPGASREKLERDLDSLTRAFADDPSDARTVFYLAQTYRDLGKPHEAIRFYRLRAEMDGFDEETYYARFQLGVLLSGHVGFAAGADELLKAWRSRPHRVEALRALAEHASHVADKYPLPDDSLFVSPDAYR